MPHIIYHDDDAGKSYFPGSAFQGAARNTYAPRHVVTSGITQPPNLGAMLEILFDKELSEHAKLYPEDTPSVPDHLCAECLKI